MRLSLFISIFFSLCQSIYPQSPSNIVLEGNSTIGFSHWPIRNNQIESVLIDDGNLIITRKKQGGLTLVSPNIDKINDNLIFDCHLSISGKKNNASGIIINDQMSKNLGYYFEFSSKGRYRILYRNNSSIEYITGNSAKGGWIKNKPIKKKKFQVTIHLRKHHFELMINGKSVFSTEISNFQNGLPGFFCEGKTKLTINSLIIMRNPIVLNTVNPSESSIEKKIDNISNDDSRFELPGENSHKELKDDVYKDLFLTIKEKSMRQQNRISELQKEIDRCKAIISMNTSNENEVENLRYSNEQLNKKIKEAELQLFELQKRNAYLEAIIEDYHSGEDGDLVINLTVMIAELKNKLNELENQNMELIGEVAQLKNDRKILMKQIKKLKN